MTGVARWIVVVSIAEAVGFAVASGTAIVLIVLNAPTAVAFPVTVAGGATEGLLLGTGQWIAMSGHRPSRRRWVAATAAAAALAWTLGLLPSTLGLDFSSGSTYVAIGIGGLALLASIPVAQWLTIRQRPGAGRWIPVNMAAWAVAILWTFAPSPFIDEHSAIPLVAVLYVTAGLLMAVTIAALTARTAAALFPAG